MSQLNHYMPLKLLVHFALFVTQSLIIDGIITELYFLILCWGVQLDLLYWFLFTTADTVMYDYAS